MGHVRLRQIHGGVHHDAAWPLKQHLHHCCVSPFRCLNDHGRSILSKVKALLGINLIFHIFTTKTSIQEYAQILIHVHYGYAISTLHIFYTWPMFTKWYVSRTTQFKAAAWKLVGVSLGEIEIFVLHHTSLIFYTTCALFFLLYSTHRCLKFCKWFTYWSIWHWEMTLKWPIFTAGLLSITCAEPHVSHTKTKVMIWATDTVVWIHPTENHFWA